MDGGGIPYGDRVHSLSQDPADTLRGNNNVGAGFGIKGSSLFPMGNLRILPMTFVVHHPAGRV